MREVGAKICIKDYFTTNFGEKYDDEDILQNIEIFKKHDTTVLIMV